MAFAGPSRRRPEALWWRCDGCEWLGCQWRGASSPLEELIRYEGEEAICMWCGDEYFATFVEYRRTPVTLDDGRTGHHVVDVCLGCGRVGSWFDDRKR
ncbi:hypothetical protein GCM10010517_23170 [Streptosporangium fragile]|uniref:Uncharacterized protein n=1 Tax=Streptosporangium fragile TaxID=46186 RepID=A0ABN3VUP3_9ACTN